MMPSGLPHLWFPQDTHFLCIPKSCTELQVSRLEHLPYILLLILGMFFSKLHY